MERRIRPSSAYRSKRGVPPKGVGTFRLGHTRGSRFMNSLVSSTGSLPASKSTPNMKLAWSPGTYSWISSKLATTSSSFCRAL